MIKVKGTARNGGFNSIQPGASDSVQNGFAPPLEVIGGTDGCYMKQFQLDQFLDHLTVIIKSGCVLDSTSGGGGGPHNVPSTLYRGECKLCEAQGVTGEYWGESGFSGFHRCERHRAEVSSRKDSNAFAKHLALYHPNEQGDIENFKIQVESVFKKPLTRQKTEAVKIQSSTATNLMNSKAEHRQPALLRVRMTRENDDYEARRQQGGERGGVRRVGA